MVTDVYGESGAGKTQLCFAVTVNCVKAGGRVMYVDTAGTFRPERIVEIGGSESALEKISVFRALTTRDQTKAIQIIPEVDPQLVVIDTLTGLFSVEYSGPARHIAVMKTLHDLAILALNSGCSVIATNMIRSVPVNVADQAGRENNRAMVPAPQREYLGSSISIYSHVKLKLEILNSRDSRFIARMIQPPGKGSAEFSVSKLGISDVP